jgi:transposase
MGLLHREISTSEREELRRLCHSRTAPVRRVERARIILEADEQMQWMAVARIVGVDKKTVRTWVDRFEQSGLKGLEDAPRSGHPFTYTAEVRADVVNTALTPPRELGQPFGSWTVERLERYFNEERGIPIKHSRIHEILAQEGLRWHHEENWLGEKVDPAFLKKRGQLSRHTRPLLRVL